jgi:hypothetical protein
VKWILKLILEVKPLEISQYDEDNRKLVLLQKQTKRIQTEIHPTDYNSLAQQVKVLTDTKSPMDAFLNFQNIYEFIIHMHNSNIM